MIAAISGHRWNARCFEGTANPDQNEKFALLPRTPHRAAQPLAHKKNPAPPRRAARLGTQAARRGPLSTRPPRLPPRRSRSVLEDLAWPRGVGVCEAAARDHQHKNRVALERLAGSRACTAGAAAMKMIGRKKRASFIGE